MSSFIISDTLRGGMMILLYGVLSVLQKRIPLAVPIVCTAKYSNNSFGIIVFSFL